MSRTASRPHESYRHRLDPEDPVRSYPRQLNVHGHALVLDGVFTEAADGTLRFHPAAAPTDLEVAWLVATIRTRVLRPLRRRGVFTEATDDDAPDPLAETSLALAGRRTEIQRCDICCPEDVTDDDVAKLPEAQKALEKESGQVPCPKCGRLEWDADYYQAVH